MDAKSKLLTLINARIEKVTKLIKEKMQMPWLL